MSVSVNIIPNPFKIAYLSSHQLCTLLRMTSTLFARWEDLTWGDHKVYKKKFITDDSSVFRAIYLFKPNFCLITVLAMHIMSTCINFLHFKSPTSWFFFTSKTKKADTYIAAPVNHIGYLRTFIHINLLYEWDYFLMQLCALTLDVRWSRNKVTALFQKIVTHLVCPASAVNKSFWNILQITVCKKQLNRNIHQMDI